MNSLELENFLRRDTKCAKMFRGVIASDQLNQLILEPKSIYIVNTAPTGHPGLHWTAIYYEDKEHLVEFWDSLGQKPEIYGPYFNDFFKRCNYQYNDTRIQGQKSTCGHFCLFYAFYKCRAFSMPSILETFSLDVTCNDAIVINFVQNLLFVY